MSYQAERQRLTILQTVGFESGRFVCSIEAFWFIKEIAIVVTRILVWRLGHGGPCSQIQSAVDVGYKTSVDAQFRESAALAEEVGTIGLGRNKAVQCTRYLDIHLIATSPSA